MVKGLAIVTLKLFLIFPAASVIFVITKFIAERKWRGSYKDVSNMYIRIWYKVVIKVQLPLIDFLSRIYWNISKN